MTIKKFLTSVADYEFYDTSDVLLCSGKALVDTTFDVKLASTQVRGGRGNQLQYLYWHSNEMTIQLNDTQWNLAALGSTVGSNITTGNSVYVQETITLGSGGGGTVVAQPLAIQSATLYGWITHVDQSIERVTFTGKTFATSSGTSGDVVCITFFANDAASRSITIPANAIPRIGRLVLTAQLNSGDQSSNKIGVVEVIIPKCQLSGSFTINMKADGVSQTPLSGTALSYMSTATSSCLSEPIYAEIIEVLDSALWYTDVIGLSVEGGNFSLATTLGTDTLVVYAVKNNGDSPFIVDNAELDFTSGTTGVATAGLHTGLITGISAGTSLITVTITDKTSIETQVTVTVPS